MYKVYSVIDMRGLAELVAEFENMDKVNEFLKNKNGFYRIEAKDQFITMQCFSDNRSNEVLDFGTLEK